MNNFKMEFHAENKISIVLDIFVGGDVSFNCRLVFVWTSTCCYPIVMKGLQ